MDRALPRPLDLWPAARRILSALSLALLAFTLVRIVIEHRPGFGDVYAYHRVWDGPIYDGAVGGAHAFLYSPVAAQVLWPFTLLPFPAFYALLLGANTAALLYLVGWRWAGWAAAVFYPVTLELAVGNIHLLLAAAIVAGWWPLHVLTKVTSGVGLLYELRTPRRFAVNVAVTTGIVAVSYLLAPDLWAEWIPLLASSSGTDPWALVDVPLLYRLPVALAIVAVAAWKGWRWLVPVACLIALPVIWVGSVCLLLAIPRLTRASSPASEESPVAPPLAGWRA